MKCLPPTKFHGCLRPSACGAYLCHALTTGPVYSLLFIKQLTLSQEPKAASLCRGRSPEPCRCFAVPSADLTASKPGAKALKAAQREPGEDLDTTCAEGERWETVCPRRVSWPLGSKGLLAEDCLAFYFVAVLVCFSVVLYSFFFFFL